MASEEQEFVAGSHPALCLVRGGAAHHVRPEGSPLGDTTNAIESLNMQIRKVIRSRGHFPNDDAATTLIWLALRNIAKNWKMPPITWRAAKTQFAILFAERFTAYL